MSETERILNELKGAIQFGTGTGGDYARVGIGFLFDVHNQLSAAESRATAAEAECERLRGVLRARSEG